MLNIILQFQVSFSEYFLLTLIIARVYALSANPTKWPNTLKQFVGRLQIADEWFECVWPFC